MTQIPPKETPPREDRPAHKQNKQKKFSWKSILTITVAVVILWQLMHVFVQSQHQNKTTAQRPTAPSSSAKPSPTPTVTIGGHRVAAGAGPLIVLNPGLVAPGGTVGVDGSGFNPKTHVLVYLKTAKSSKIVARGYTSRYGTMTTGFSLPFSASGAAHATVVAQQAGGGQATAALITPGGMGTAKIYGKAAGKPGDKATVNAAGFQPGEKVNVYWGRISGTPAATLTADGSGSISMASVPVGIAPVGPTTLVLVGQRSHTTATAPYQMLGLYPSVTLHPWAIKAGHAVTFAGSGFAPNEPVLIYLDASSGTPALTATASSTGTISVSFVVPFGLKGMQHLTAVGSQSRTSVSSGMDILPYMPSGQASTYDALPGTTVSFYANGFAANEVVEVFTNGGPGRGGKLVTAFRVDSKGSAANAGQYLVPSGTGPYLGFTMVGQKSGGVGHAKISVGAAPQGVTVPPQPPYVLPPTLGGKPTPKPSSKGSPSSAPTSSHP